MKRHMNSANGDYGYKITFNDNGANGFNIFIDGQFWDTANLLLGVWHVGTGANGTLKANFTGSKEEAQNKVQQWLS